MTYVPLHVHSNFSLCSGTASPEQLLDRARRYGIRSLALTDTANLYGAIPFYQAASESGITPILGASVPTQHGPAILLARNYEGYENLCRLITQVHLGAPPGTDDSEISPLDSVAGFDQKIGNTKELTPLTTLAIMCHQAGLFILTPSPELLSALVDDVSHEFLRAEIIRPARSINEERRLLDTAQSLGIRTVGTTAAMLLDPAETRLHRVLVAMRKNELVTREANTDHCLPEHYLCPADEFERRFSDLPESVTETRAVGEQCRLHIPLGKPIFPEQPLSDGRPAEVELRQMTEDGLRWRYQPVTPRAKLRLEYELEVITKLGFVEYFLVVADIMRFARSQRLPSVGRGSGASSIVSYVLGITNVDPIRYNIQFERFLNLSRSDCPDIDIDFCWQRRDDVIDYVFRKYGAAHTSMISTHNTFRDRGAFREVAKACGVSNEDVSRLQGSISMDEDVPVERAVSGLPATLDISDDHLHRIVRHARHIVGFPHHLSVHCGGIVISPKTIDSYTPLQRAAKGVIITQYEMHAVEDIGLVKIDLLGNRALSTIDETIRLVHEHRGLEVSSDKIPEDDPKTLDMVKNGRTLSVNQLESPAMRNLLIMAETESVEDIIATLALVRPGAAGAGMKEEFVRRKRGLSPVTFPHDCVKDVLEDSLGVMLYEDDAMLVASRMLDLSLEEGDRFRKSLKKAQDEDAQKLIHSWFVERSVTRGIPEKSVEEMWSQIRKFGGYSFCKSHSCGYGQVAYQCAYLKQHFPAEFMAAVMNHHAGMYSKSVHLEEAKRMGVAVRLPCVNRSEIEFTVLEGDLQIGLSQIKGLSLRSMQKIVRERASSGAFESLNDFLSRLTLQRTEMESLILCGSFDFAGSIRPALMWELGMTYDAEKRLRNSHQLFKGNFHAIAAPVLRDFSPEQKLNQELFQIEMCAHEHILAVLRPHLPSRDLARSEAVREYPGRRLRLLGMLAATRTVDTDAGKMVFITLEDEQGLWESTLFPREYREYGGEIGAWGPYLVEGVVEEQYGARTLRLHSIQLLGRSETHRIEHRPRDELVENFF
ncbi:MAG: DNA polymerase III subunit alpha [Planctomycetota bacterium]|nr:DNA polymerase III subunit alpha [Planctomycetota bacterium]MDA1142686.1 DNA polymerase III subunit alpha [Planctomycetota bacterium]